MMPSIFDDVKQAPVIEIFTLSEKCTKDPFPDKVNLTIGAYRTNEAKPWVLPVVHEVEKQMLNDPALNKEYLPITGLQQFCDSSIKLLFGESNPLLACGKVDGVQCLGGTGALYVAMQFLKVIMHTSDIYVSSPTWPNHKGIPALIGCAAKEYRYWNTESRAVDFPGMLADLESAVEGSTVVLHACAHNPTGMDLTKDQWKTLAELIKRKKLFPLFDIAYQGFASGDVEEDAWAVRYFAEQGFELFAAQSYSKNFGLYNERVGNLAIVTTDAAVTARVKSQLKIIVRRTWSNPPQHGCRIVSTVLQNPALRAEWSENVADMAKRVIAMRKLLFEKLRALGTPGSWDHIVTQRGMFSYSGLTSKQAETLMIQNHIYILSDGRLNMCGLTTHNIDYVAKAIHDVVTKN